MRSILRGLLIAWIALSISASVFSTTINVPENFLTIQEAIDATVDGDTVLVADGSYEENLLIDGRSIVLKSENGRDYTNISSDTSRCITITSSSNINIIGFSLTGYTTEDNLFGSRGGAVYIDESEVIINNSSIINSVSYSSLSQDAYGGGIYSLNSSLMLFNCNISDNIANAYWAKEAYGGGIYCIGGLLIDSQCIISNNHAYSRPYDGTSYVNDSDNSRTPPASGPAFGGGIYCIGNDVQIRNSDILSNICGGGGGHGGGIYLEGDNFLVEYCYVDRNSKSGYDYLPCYGGGLYVDGDNGFILENKIRFNGLLNDGAWADNYSCKGGGLYLYGNGNVINDNIFTENTMKASFSYRYSSASLESYGGGCYLEGNNIFERNIVSRNSAITYRSFGEYYPSFQNLKSHGGGCYIDGASIVTNNSIIENYASSEIYLPADVSDGTFNLEIKGGGCYINNVAEFNNNIIAYNQISTICNATFDPELVEGEGCVESVNGAGVYIESSPNGCNVYFGNLGGAEWIGENSPTNFNENPDLCNYYNKDYRLRSDSPCLSENNDCNVLIGAINDICPFICGDCDIDGRLNILDIVYLLNFIYKDGPATYPRKSGDIDHNWVIGIKDVVYLINCIYKDGPDPICP